uniref:Uncharacterized protein n=1 Tax=Rhizophora mucronata TaxID=61149 RepID=A0A2P2NIZ3_RHIMU
MRCCYQCIAPSIMIHLSNLFIWTCTLIIILLLKLDLLALVSTQSEHI